MSLLVCFSGLPGVGKSTLAKTLAAQRGALYLRIDVIEAAMRASHMVCEDLADGGYAAAQATTRAALDQGFDVIADCVNPIQLTRGSWRKASQKHSHLDIWLTCNDRAEHRHRVETRVSDIEDAKLPTWQAVEARAFDPFPCADIQLDTSQLTIEEAVQCLHAAVLAANKEDSHV